MVLYVLVMMTMVSLIIVMIRASIVTYEYRHCQSSSPASLIITLASPSRSSCGSHDAFFDARILACLALLVAVLGYGYHQQLAFQFHDHCGRFPHPLV